MRQAGPMSTVIAVCRVDRLLPDSGVIGVTAIDKRPVDGPVRVRPLGLHADVQADRKHHGGEDQAVYAYADEDAEHFAAMLDRPVPPGLFGENLRTSGVELTGAVIGERWRVGETLLLEVTIPRIPCGTFARRMGVAGWVKRFAEEGRPGAYLRVLKSRSSTGRRTASPSARCSQDSGRSRRRPCSTSTDPSRRRSSARPARRWLRGASASRRAASGRAAVALAGARPRPGPRR
jgi:hypothetical protein